MEIFMSVSYSEKFSLYSMAQIRSLPLRMLYCYEMEKSRMGVEGV